MKGGQVQHIWLDAESFLEVKVEGTPRRMDNKMRPVSIYLRDYKSVSGAEGSLRHRDGRAGQQGHAQNLHRQRRGELEVGRWAIRETDRQVGIGAATGRGFKEEVLMKLNRLAGGVTTVAGFFFLSAAPAIVCVLPRLARGTMPRTSSRPSAAVKCISGDVVKAVHPEFTDERKAASCAPTTKPAGSA